MTRERLVVDRKANTTGTAARRCTDSKVRYRERAVYCGDSRRLTRENTEVAMARIAEFPVNTKSDDPRDRYGSDAPMETAQPVEAPYEGLPVLGVTEPIHLLALRGELAADMCNACGESVALHYETSGCLWIGCKGAESRRRLGLLTTLNGLLNHSLREVHVWGDTYPHVSEALRDVLSSGCGQVVADFYATLTPDARLHLSRRLAEMAVLAFRQAEGKAAQP